MGHPRGPQGPYVRGTCTADFADFKFWSFGVHMNSLYQWYVKDIQKIQKRLEPGVGPKS